MLLGSGLRTRARIGYPHISNPSHHSDTWTAGASAGIGNVCSEAERKVWLELLAGSLRLIYKDVPPSGRGQSMSKQPRSKYDGLRDHLRQQTWPELSLTFKEIEKIIGTPLPKSAVLPQWWANTTDPHTSHTQRKAWGDAGYDAFLIVGSDRVMFRKARN